MGSGIKLKPWQHRSRSEWVVLVDESRQCGAPVRKFCAERGISSAALYKWRSRLRKEPGAKAVTPDAFSTISKENLAFVPLKIMAIGEKPPVILSPESPDTSRLAVPESLSRINSRFILQNAGGVKIEFPGGCIATELRLVLEALSC